MKPVIVRKLTRDWCAGYTSTEFSADGLDLELLDSSGKLSLIPMLAIKWICYVRELAAGGGSLADRENPERLLRRRFSSRPRTVGVWLRLALGDGEEIEGVAANDRSLVDGVGLLLTPPDTRSNTQRIFVPRSSIRELTILGVVAAPVSKRVGRKTGEEAQPDLFGVENGRDELG